MKNYYEVLGLSASATQSEIKHVFRRLAVTYHPDKNPSPDAEAIFKEVNEAYEILSDPLKRNAYDQLLLNGTTIVVTQPEQPWHPDPAYRRRRAAGYKPPPAAPSPRVVMMESMLNYFRVLSWIGIIWCLIITIDYMMPFAVSDETVLSDVHMIRRMNLRDHPDLLFTDKGHHFPLEIGELKYFEPQSRLHIYRSAMFSLLVKLENEDHTYEVNNLATLYRNFIFAPALLFLLSGAGIVVKKGIEFRYNVGVVLILISFLNIFFFFQSRI